MTHPDRRRYGGLDPAPPDGKETGPARFEANVAADFSADVATESPADTAADDAAGAATDFPADPTGPAAAGFKGHRG